MSDTAAAATTGRTYKKVVGESNLRFIRPSQLAEDGFEGEVLEGVYIGPITNQLDASKTDFKFETEEETVVINHSGSLAYKMKSVPINSLVRIVYNGLQPMKGGKMKGKEAHNFDVYIAEE